MGLCMGEARDEGRWKSPRWGSGTTIALSTIATLSLLPSLAEAAAVVWGEWHGYTGRALRDGLDFWAGGFLALHHRVNVVFDPKQYESFLTGLYGGLPPHIWSYPPNYLLIASAFGWLAPWHAVLAFDFASLVLLVVVLRFAGLGWWLVMAVALSPASFENLLEGQNAALVTALIGGGILLLPKRPRLGGALVGLASIKPQLGVPLPFYLLRRSPLGFAYAVLAAIALALLSLFLFGFGSWVAFWRVTRPAMTAVLLSGHPKDFAGGLISVFAAVRFLGVPAALAIQGVVSLSLAALAALTTNPVVVLILAAIASPYLHGYDLLGVALAVGLLVEERLATGFMAGEAVLLFVAWAGPGILAWLPFFAPLAPVVLILLLAIAGRRGRRVSEWGARLRPTGRSAPSGIRQRSTGSGA